MLYRRVREMTPHKDPKNTRVISDANDVHLKAQKSI